MTASFQVNCLQSNKKNLQIRISTVKDELVILFEYLPQFSLMSNAHVNNFCNFTDVD